MYYRQTRFCRLCQDEYIPKKDIGRDGFCCNHHRIMLHRFVNKLKRKGRLPESDTGVLALRAGR